MTTTTITPYTEGDDFTTYTPTEDDYRDLAAHYAAMDMDSEIIDQEDEPYDACTNPQGHEWVYTGTSYGGDDPRWSGEGRCYCAYCGADGDA